MLVVRDAAWPHFGGERIDGRWQLPREGLSERAIALVLVVSKPQGELCGYAPRGEPEGNTQRKLLGRHDGRKRCVGGRWTTEKLAFYRIACPGKQHV